MWRAASPSSISGLGSVPKRSLITSLRLCKREERCPQTAMGTGHPGWADTRATSTISFQFLGQVPYLDVQVLKCCRIPAQQLHWVLWEEAHTEEASHAMVVCPLHNLCQEQRGAVSPGAAYNCLQGTRACLLSPGGGFDFFSSCTA